MVRYKFDVGVDDTRKEAFRAAAADWRTHTCIAVVEDDNAETWSGEVNEGLMALLSSRFGACSFSSTSDHVETTKEWPSMRLGC